MKPYILPLKDIVKKTPAGNKAHNLAELARYGFKVPTTYVCTWQAYHRYIEGDSSIFTELQRAIPHILHKKLQYAVRSSADMEDGTQSSFAGQFDTVLNVEGVDAIVDAIKHIWDTAQNEAVSIYMQTKGHKFSQPRVAVLIQEMIEPHISGVAFSKNPVTGMNEIIVEAVEGSGEALVQAGTTPYRWIHKWGTWIEEPETTKIDQALISEIVRQTKLIAAKCKCAVDLEWVYDGDQIYWVQLRNITAMDIPVYSNRISREVFPGIIKPLIWSINVPLVNGAWIRLLTELIGPNSLQPGDLAGYFYYRAYFNMGTLGTIFELMGMPRETLEVLLGLEIEAPDVPTFKPSRKTYQHLPRMFLSALDKLAFGRKIEKFLQIMHAQYHAFKRENLTSLSETTLLGYIDKLYPMAQEGAYYNIVTLLSALLYNRMLKGKLASFGINFENFDLTRDLPTYQQYNPNFHLAQLHVAFKQLEKTSQDQIRDQGYTTLRGTKLLDNFQEQVNTFLNEFGHLSDSGNDFSQEPWRETPELILRIIADYDISESEGRTKVTFNDLPVKGLQRLWTKVLYKRASRFALYREVVSSLYTFGYGLFRDYYLALGESFAKRHIFKDKHDIFYLYADEIKGIIEKPVVTAQYQTWVDNRKQEIQAVREAIPPAIIYGNEAPPLETKGHTTLLGIPTSRGYYTGPVKVLQGIKDFSIVVEGDVLVVPYSDVGWTPLFAKAGAIVSEAGGMLSHSSIVAREYAIPAVVSVANACQLKQNSLVTVDGFKGEVVIHS